MAAPEALNEFADKSFDVITLWHVMEHLEHLNETWETLKRILKDQGILINSCAQPYFIRCRKIQRNVGCLRCSPTLVAFQSLRHAAVWSQTRLYSLRTASECLLMQFYVSMLSEKYRKSAFPFIKGLITGAEAWIVSLAKKDRSSSMIYVFRKK